MTVPAISGCRFDAGAMWTMVRAEAGTRKGEGARLFSPGTRTGRVQLHCRPPGIERRNPHNNAMPKRSSYQERVIRNYYQNRDTIMLQRLGELVTDLFLSEGKAKVRLWKRVAEILDKLKIPKSQIQHLVRSDNPTLVANLLKKLLEES